MDLIGKLTVPADPAWLTVRITSLLLPYFEKDTLQSAREMAMDDWIDALEGFPRWAIHAAVKWWQSDDNTKRRSMPLHGDITARVKLEMGAVRAAQIKLRSSATIPQKTKPDEPKDFSPEAVERRRLVSQELLGSANRMPREQSEAQTQRNINAARRMGDAS